MISNAQLLAAALWELFVYDVVMFCVGFSGIHRLLARQSTCGTGGVAAERICGALANAMTLYWRRVHCLQRSAAATRLLRRYGWDAHLIIGYRPVPFFSHAWVEVDGRVVNDSPAYKRQLHVLDRI